MTSSKYCTGNSVVVPSHAAGVKIGASARMKPSPLKKSRTALTTSWRTLQDRGLPLGADPEVAVIEQEVDAVLLRRDRVVVRGPDDLEARRHDLEAALGTRVGADRAADDEGGFLGEVVGLLKVSAPTSFLPITAWMKPVPSRTTRKWILPLDRRLWSQPLSVTVLAGVLADAVDRNVGGAHWLISSSLMPRRCSKRWRACAARARVAAGGAGASSKVHGPVYPTFWKASKARVQSIDPS